MPDVYQGTELWETSLVDPDNRRPVDFARRRRCSREIDAGALPADRRVRRRQAAGHRAALRLRRDRPELFTGYTPLTAAGPAADHLVAFDRGGAITVATRLPVGLAEARRLGRHHARPRPAARAATCSPAAARRRRDCASPTCSPTTRSRCSVTEGGEAVTIRHPLAVWAPSRSASASGCRATTTCRWCRGDDGWWAPAEGELPTSRPTPTTATCSTTTHRALPDPRSRRQPDGVHALSRTFDPAAYALDRRAWTGRQLAGGVIYELHIGTFTPEGTLDAAIERLDHLVELGVDFVELLPVNAFNGTHNWGYDGVLWYAVHETYGGPAAYQRFVDACHARGLAVIQDVVYNHLGPIGNYLPRVRPLPRRGGAQHLGRVGEPRRPGLGRGARATSSTTR